MMTDYTEASQLGLTHKDRWGNGTPHHEMSLRLMEFLRAHDTSDFEMYFDWEMGGDGDNGETLMFQMDPFFELLDSVNSPPKDSNADDL